MGTQRAKTRRTSIFAGLAVVVIGLASTTTAQADGGVNSDALQMLAQVPVGVTGVSAAAYGALFAGTPSDPPTGVIVADSGFRPFPNGFSFVNFGNDLTSNQRYFAQPTSLGTSGNGAVALGLDTASMRRLILTYDKWAGDKGVPSLWLDEESDGSLDAKIPMRKV